MQFIQRLTVGSGGTPSVTFNNIPQTFTDLVIVQSARSTGDFAFGSWQHIRYRLNDSTANYSGRYLDGNGSSPGSSTESKLLVRANDNNSTANTFGNASVYICNYTANSNKSYSVDLVTESNETAALQYIAAGLWSDTSPITSIVIDGDGLGNLAQNSTFTLYGINRYSTSAAPKATGGIISFDAVNNKWVHTFTASGTFTPTTSLTADVLVVSGGGGGSNSGGLGAGGGGGSFTQQSGVSVSSATTVTVGAGGAADATSVGPGAAGSSSAFGAISASVANGATGSSSLGGNGGNSQKVINGTTTSYTGGTGTGPAPNRRGGSGAGAGANGSSSYPAVGGNGLQWLDNNYYAGGGGGGFEQSGSQPRTAGGLGGGGEGGRGTVSPNFNATNGTANTGGGGGGAGGLTGVVGGSSGAGGSGIVIVRYDA
jgi:hypothetical protein